MYELKRKKKIEESLKIGDEVLTISIEPEAVARDFNRVRSEIIRAQSQIKSAGPDELEAAQEYYGAALIALMKLLLGEENTEKVVAFYEGNYIEMTSEVIGYLADVIVPQIDETIKAMRGRASEQYKSNRVARRFRK